MERWIIGFLWVIIAGMAVMSIVLLSGKGSNLIAGFNTASEKEKAKYNEKKLCRTMGIGLSIITIDLAFCLTFQFEFAYSFIDYVVIAVFILACAFMLIASNTICRKK